MKNVSIRIALSIILCLGGSSHFRPQQLASDAWNPVITRFQASFPFPVTTSVYVLVPRGFPALTQQTVRKAGQGPEWSSLVTV